jgi:hypothetical protein
MTRDCGPQGGARLIAGHPNEQLSDRGGACDYGEVGTVMRHLG